MAKHICGTCRFYEEAGLAGSGWCHHPQRNVTTGAKVLVRRNELACRDDWQHSLWESAAEPRTAEPAVTERAMPIGPLPPASPRTMRALIASPDVETHEGEDVLLSEARIVSETHEPRQTAARPEPAAGFDPRTAIFRARESFRDRARVRSTAARQATGAFAEPGTTASDSALESGSDARQPSETGVTPVLPQPQSIGQRAAGAGEVSAPVIVAEYADPNDVTPATDARAPESRPAPTALAAESVESGQIEQPAAESREMGQAGKGAVRSEPPAVDRGEERAARSDLPIWFRTDLPRICRSCRDYRPAADGQRGWCANTWAFTHSRLVQADQVAPCQSAIGDWWVPADDVWLVAADVSAHGRPTPLLDRTGVADTTRRRRS